MHIPYLPLHERTPDFQYQNLLRDIKDRGETVTPQQGHPARVVIGRMMRFPIKNGFPIITERDLVSPGEKSGSQFQMAIGELCAFLNGAQTLEDMKQFGCGWWSRWVTPEKCAKRGLEPGDLGPGSYGAAFRRFPTADGAPFDQIATLIEQIKENPHLRTLEVSPWIPQYIPRGHGRTQQVVVAPCHGWLHVHINQQTNEMTLFHRQRSADVPVGLVFNLQQYAALLLMLAQVTGYTPKELVYCITDAHIYEQQLSAVEKLIAEMPNPFPAVNVDPGVTDIFAFRPEHFTVEGYVPKLGRMIIWTPV